MAWGIEVWGEDSWAPEGNFSFELRGAPDGTAEDWSVSSVAGDERIGAFDEIDGPGDSYWGSSIWNEDYYSTGLILWSWDPWEDFEDRWHLPHHVHFAVDAANVVTAPDATIGDWPAQRTLIGELYDKYKKHLLVAGDVHTSQDTTNFIPLSEPTSLPEAIGFTNLFSLLLYAATTPGSGVNDAGHFTMWGLLGVHGREDVINRPALGECTDEATMVALANHLKVKFNAHLSTRGYGVGTEGSTFAFSGGRGSSITMSGEFATLQLNADAGLTDAVVNTYVTIAGCRRDGFNNGRFLVTQVLSDDRIVCYNPAGTNETVTFKWYFDLEALQIRDLDYEGFERGWAIPEILPYVWDYPPFPDRQECQTDMVSTDGQVPAGWGGTVWDDGSLWGPEHNPSWKVGHEEFWRDLSDIMVQEAIPGGERFEHSWKLPGSSGTWYNERFVAQFWDQTTEEWRFAPGRTQLGITENFETAWKDNEVGLAKYWSGTEWRFLDTWIAPDRRLQAAGFGSYTFGTYKLGTGQTLYTGLTAPNYSPLLWAEVTEELDAGHAFQVFFWMPNNVVVWTLFIFENARASLEVGAVQTKCIEFMHWITDPQEEFYVYFGGARSLTQIAPDTSGTGKVAIKGYAAYAETFESDWTLTLEI